MDSRSNWKAFAKGDLAARDTLLTENLSLVHHVARQLERKLTNELDHDELVSAGTLGLMAAMNSFDPERGLAFSTFAVPRIRGAILDELRRQDHVPRSVRRKDARHWRGAFGRSRGSVTCPKIPRSPTCRRRRATLWSGV
jgi:RNA polymerase sigma factor for flagellar operon FliA